MLILIWATLLLQSIISNVWAESSLKRIGILPNKCLVLQISWGITSTVANFFIFCIELYYKWEKMHESKMKLVETIL